MDKLAIGTAISRRKTTFVKLRSTRDLLFVLEISSPNFSPNLRVTVYLFNYIGKLNPSLTPSGVSRGYEGLAASRNFYEIL